MYARTFAHFTTGRQSAPTAVSTQKPFVIPHTVCLMRLAFAAAFIFFIN